MNQNPVRGTSNAEMSNILAYKGADKKVVAFEEEVKKWFAYNSKRMTSLCGNPDDARRLLLAALNSVLKTPSLMECDFNSFATCLLTSAEYRLFPGAMQECVYLPFKNRATFVLMYPGICQLLYRSGMIKDIEADVVCARDVFEYTRGSNRKLVFEPFDGEIEDRGEWIGAYSIIRNTFGGEHIRYLTAREIMGLKSRSPGGNSSFSPWNSQYPLDVAWMWMKSALKQNKFVPKSAVLAAALEADHDNIVTDDSVGLSATVQRTAQAVSAPSKPIAQEPHKMAIEAPPQREAIEIPVTKTAEPVSQRPFITEAAKSQTTDGGKR